MRNRLLRLRHDTVVGCDDEHGDVGHLRAAGAHGGERLVARRVEERDEATRVICLIRADVLRDPARLGRDDRGLADRVEQRRLAVVDVTHDRDDRRARLERVLGILENLGLGVVVVRVLDRHFALELGGDHHDLIVGERLRRRLHRAEVHQQLDDLRHRDAERLREVAQRDAGLDGRGTGRCRDLARLARPAIGRTVARPLALAGAGTSAAAVDDDATAPFRAASAGSDRSVRLAVGHFVRHQCRDGRDRGRRGRSCAGCG